nr:MAG TPA: hypothetical protein [Caudoviricetes sp.]
MCHDTNAIGTTSAAIQRVAEAIKEDRSVEHGTGRD